MDEVVTGGGWYEKAVGDPEFARRVRLAYTGHHDALDALWWSEHPTDYAPSGRPSPADRIRTLQRVVFAPPRSGSAEKKAVAAAAAELRELQGELDAEKAAIVCAVATAERELAERRHVDAEETAPARSDAEHDPHDGSPFVISEPARPERPRPTRIRLIASAIGVGGLVAGFAIGSQVPMAGSWGDQPTTTPVAAGVTSTIVPRSYPEPLSADGVPSPYSIFNRTIAGDDVPVGIFPGSFDATTFRLLAPAQNGAGAVYAVRNSSAQVCVLLLGSRPADYASACTTDTVFPSSGITVQLSTMVGYIAAENGASVDQRVDLEATWNPDGTVVSRATPTTLPGA
jgi:hypothetical protein